MTNLIYTGIGSRETPADVIKKMITAAKALGKGGWTLRSGGAAGADQAFETGCNMVGGDKEIYLPWRGFRRNPSPLYGTTKEARMIAKAYHPAWENLSSAAWEFMGRNSYQVLGQDLNTHTAFILCWTPEGAITGGTGQALRIAEAYDIPILNFGKHTDAYISKFIEELDDKLKG